MKAEIGRFISALRFLRLIIFADEQRSEQFFGTKANNVTMEQMEAPRPLKRMEKFFLSLSVVSVSSVPDKIFIAKAMDRRKLCSRVLKWTLPVVLWS